MWAGYRQVNRTSTIALWSRIFCCCVCKKSNDPTGFGLACVSVWCERIHGFGVYKALQTVLHSTWAAVALLHLSHKTHHRSYCGVDRGSCHALPFQYPFFFLSSILGLQPSRWDRGAFHSVCFYFLFPLKGLLVFWDTWNQFFFIFY